MNAANHNTESTHDAIAALQVGAMIQIPGRVKPVRIARVNTMDGVPIAWFESGSRFGFGMIRACRFKAGKFIHTAHPGKPGVQVDGFEVV